MTSQSLPISPAERSRHCRQRKRDNVHLVTVEVDEPALKGLVALGFVAEADSRDRDVIEDGVFMFMQAVAEGGIDVREEWIERTFG